MNSHHIFTALLIMLLACTTLAGGAQFAAQPPQTPEPPLATPPGAPGVRQLPLNPPGVRDVPTPGTPPRVRILPTPPSGGQPAPTSTGTYNPVDPPAPVVSIKVRVPASGTPGEDLEYRLCLENHAKTPAHHVIIRNPLPANATFVRADPAPSGSDPVLEWRLGTLEACARREIILVLKPTGNGDINNCARVQFEHGECVVTKIGPPAANPPTVPLPQSPTGAPRLQVRMTGPAESILHHPITYRLEVVNVGAAPAERVVLTDTMPDGMQDGATGKKELTWDVGTLAAGESRNYEFQAITTKEARLCNRAAVASGNLREETESCVSVHEAKLSIKKTGPQSMYLKRPGTYQITVSNDGKAALANVVVTDALPKQTQLVQSSPGGQMHEDRVEWLLGTLPPGARKTVQITLQASEAGKIVNRASVQAAGVPPVSAEAVTTFESAAGLTFYPEIADSIAELKKPTRFTITVINTGSAVANDMDLTAEVPRQMEIKEIRPKDSFERNGQQITFKRIPALEAAKQAMFEIDVVPIEPAADAAMRVKMTTKELPQGVTKEVRVNIVPNGAPPESR